MKNRIWLSVTRATASSLHAQLQCRLTCVLLDTRPLVRGYPELCAAKAFHTKSRLCIESSGNSYSQPAENLSHNVTQEEQDHYERTLHEDSKKQVRTPWHREGVDQPPVEQQRSKAPLTKGKLLTTPSRMLKLILPLTSLDSNNNRENVAPLALLVHPQQPLSYLERLIQSEIPTIKDGDRERIPRVYFCAEDSMQDGEAPSRPAVIEEEETMKDESEEFQDADMTKIEGQTHRTGKLNSTSRVEADALRGGHGEGGVESYSGLGREASEDKTAQRKFVRWSSSTEIGDFIRDAARGQEFAIEIEGAPNDIRVGVPSFNDRTYYLRLRLKKKSKEIAAMADIKKECDELAKKGARRVAYGGFGVLAGWWYLVYRLTFETELGWDVMEPVTYLVGLSTVIGAYVWFLYHNREVSYRSAMNYTISKRQSKLYDARGFDLRKWEGLIEEANALRREIKAVANEYDVDWDEMEDEKSEKVAEALKKDRIARERNKGDKNRKGDEEDDET